MPAGVAVVAGAAEAGVGAEGVVDDRADGEELGGALAARVAGAGHLEELPDGSGHGAEFSGPAAGEPPGTARARKTAAARAIAAPARKAVPEPNRVQRRPKTALAGRAAKPTRPWNQPKARPRLSGRDEVGDERPLGPLRERRVDRVDAEDREERERRPHDGEEGVAGGVERPGREEDALSPDAVGEAAAPRPEGGADRVREGPDERHAGGGDADLARLQEEERVGRGREREERDGGGDAAERRRERGRGRSRRAASASAPAASPPSPRRRGRGRRARPGRPRGRGRSGGRGRGGRGDRRRGAGPRRLRRCPSRGGGRRPRRAVSGGVTSAMSASRGAERTPLPIRSRKRTRRTWGQAVARATSGRTTDERPYPATTSGFRRGARSERRPETTFTAAAVASATPSMSPSAAAGAPGSVARRTGRSGKIISDEASVRNDTAPRATTVRGRREGECEGCGASLHDGVHSAGRRPLREGRRADAPDAGRRAS